MRFARWTFLLAGLYGVVVLLPQYFVEDRFGLNFPPAVTHPEFYYGFTGVALAWQFAYLLIGADPARYRPLMLIAVFAKCSFGVAAIALYVQGRLAVAMLAVALVDLLLAALFSAAWAIVGRNGWTPAQEQPPPRA